MTKEQLDTIREHVSFDDVSIHDVIPLLAEVERLTNDLAMARQVSGELCEACGWAMKFPGEPCRCELLDEVERLKEREESLVKQVVAQIGFIGRQAEWREGAFKRGAEAMREAVAGHFEERARQQRLAGDYIMAPVHEASATRIRALSIPEDK
jgi:hypothetical protein